MPITKQPFCGKLTKVSRDKYINCVSVTNGRYVEVLDKAKEGKSTKSGKGSEGLSNAETQRLAC